MDCGIKYFNATTSLITPHHVTDHWMMMVSLRCRVLNCFLDDTRPGDAGADVCCSDNVANHAGGSPGLQVR